MVRSGPHRLFTLVILGPSILAIGVLVACGSGSSDPGSDTPVPPAATPQLTATIAAIGNTPVPATTSPAPVADLGPTPVPQPDPVVGTLVPPGNALAITVRDGLAYIANGLEGIRIVDISDPSAAVEVGTLNTPVNSFDVSVSGDVAYIADARGGLQIIDISDPAAPLPLASIETAGDAFALYLSDGVVYVAEGSSGILIVDVSDPSAPAVLGTIDTPGDGLGVIVVNGIAYVADGDEGLRIFDVSDPAAPVELGAFGGGEIPVLDVAISDGLAYVTSAFFGLHVVDISDPSNPVEVGALENLDIVQFPDQHQFLAIAIVVEDGLAYVAGGLNSSTNMFEGMLRVFDVSDPTAPREIGAWRGPPFPALNVVLDGGLAYVSAGTSGMRIIDPEIIISNGLPQLSFELP